MSGTTAHRTLAESSKLLLPIAMLLVLFGAGIAIDTGGNTGMNLNIEDPGRTFYGNLTVNVSVDKADVVKNVTVYRNTTKIGSWARLGFDDSPDNKSSITVFTIQNANGTATYLNDQPMTLNITSENSTHMQWKTLNTTAFNITQPPTGGAGSAVKFSDRTTDLGTVENLGSTRFIVEPRVNGTTMGSNPNGPDDKEPWTGFRVAGKLNASDVNFSDASVGSDLRTLHQAISITIQPEGSYGDNRIFIDTSKFSGFGQTNVTLYWLPLPSFKKSYIQSDPGAAGGVKFFSYDGGNLTFQVSGFSGYNATDNETPIITTHSPLNDTASEELNFNFTFNGTGSDIRNDTVELAVHNESDSVTAFYNLSDFACSGAGEILDCNITPVPNEGNYSFNVSAGDWGGLSGNNETIRGKYVYEDRTLPNATNDLNLTEANSSSVITTSPLVDQVMSSSGVGLDWAEHAATEIADLVTWVDRIELWARNQSFNRSTASMDGFGQWYKLNGSIDAATTLVEEGLAGQHEYQFNLSTVDEAGNENY
ncbi:MAG: hypothetical protein SVW02_02665, partial [Candidatus Nanohaloarchaea archaeon]|nr:hypothetical protein [Candidatus Nanohaloarchaea archaeon]